MLKKTLVSLALGSILGICASASQAVTLNTTSLDQTLMREASEGPRGADNERPGDRHRRGGRTGASDNSSTDWLLAREASEGPRGADNERPGDRQRRNRGGRNGLSAETGNFDIAREASEGPRGADHERPGDRHRQRRGGRHGVSVDAGSFDIAREASEAPRGADNHNHRRNRGGRNA